MINDEIKRTEELIRWQNLKISGLSISSDPRSRITGACFDLAHEHQMAILMLIANQLTGSAFALLRCSFEAYIRGLWLGQVATEADLEKFREEKLEKTFGKMIEEIEALEKYDVGILSKAKQYGWNSMNGFTHSGFQHLVRRNTSDYIEPNYSDEEKLEVIRFSSAIGILAAIEVAEQAQNREFAEELLERAESHF